MSKQISYILGIITTLLLGSFFYSKFCCTESHQEKKEQIIIRSNTKTESHSNSFELIGNGFNYSCKNNFNFNKGEFNTIKPIHKDIDSGIEKLKLYFEKNPNKRIIITAYSLKSEKNSSAYPNLGFARANNIKNHFVIKGLDPNRFEIRGKLVNNWNTEEDLLFGPVSYSITNNQITARAQDWKAKKENFNSDPLLLYFNPNQSEIILNEQERQRIADLAEYLDNVPNAYLCCTGYTDNTGDKYINIQSGQDMAVFAKDYLVKNGISEDKIQIFSKGSDEPIADNLTPEGKAKNRRTVITLK